MEGYHILPVQLIFIDQVDKLIYKIIDAWYKERGIDHVNVGPKRSQNNPVMLQDQSLGNYAHDDAS